MQHIPEEWGRPRRDHLLPTRSAPSNNLPIGHTQYSIFICFRRLICLHFTFSRQPIVTGTSVIAIKYADGVMMATDCLGIYQFI